MKRLIFAFLLVGGGFLLTQCGGSDSTSPTSVETTSQTEPAPPQGQPYALLKVRQGTIVIKLLPDVAPGTVRRFVELAELGFYDRTTFHRVLKDRMIQGGDPLSLDNDPYNDGQGQSSELLPQEFSDLPFERGTVAMGRQEGSDNGGSCQFFICLRDTPEWKSQYNLFGRVVEGIEVAEEISRVPLTKDNHPLLKNRPAGKQVIESLEIEYRQE